MELHGMDELLDGVPFPKNIEGSGVLVGYASRELSLGMVVVVCAVEGRGEIG
jgi:hypothetical protein